MNVSHALRTLTQVPGNYPLEVEQGGKPHEVLTLEYSHDPARAVLKLAGEPAPAEVHNDDPFSRFTADLTHLVFLIETARDTNRADKNLEDVQQMLKGALTCWRKFAQPGVAVQSEDYYLAGFERWWGSEGSAMRPLPGEDAEAHTRRLTEIAWSNGRYVRVHGAQSTERCESGCDAPVVTHDAEGVPLCRECADDLAKEVGIYSWSTEDGDGQSGGFHTIEEALADAETDLRQREANAVVIVYDSRPATAEDRELFDAPSDEHDPIDFTKPDWFAGLRVPENEVARREFRFADAAAANRIVKFFNGAAPQAAAPLPEPEATIAEQNGEVPPAPVPVEPAAEPLVDAPAEPDAGEVQHARNHPEEVAAPIGTAPAKKTRRAKSQPTADAAKE